MSSRGLLPHFGDDAPSASTRNPTGGGLASSGEQCGDVIGSFFHVTAEAP